MTRLVPPARAFLCLRHGATDWNRQGRFQGRTDNPLNDDGLTQARAAAARLQNVRLRHIVSSPLIRALQTAEIVASASAAPITVDHGIIECDFGSLEGRSIREAMHEHGITSIKDLVSILPPDDEAWASVSTRALACVSQWLDRYPGAEILFVCHDAAMQSLVQSLCHHWFENHQGTPFRFASTGSEWSMAEV